MILTQDLKKNAKARVEDADALFNALRYDGAVYICGYAIEMGLKARICRTLKWPGFPSTNNEFKDYRDFKTHNLDVLLHLSGIEDKIKVQLINQWSKVADWDPSIRYQPIGTAKREDAKEMIFATKSILKAL